MVSSRFAPRILPVGSTSVSVGSPSTCGITATPVSKPERPRASFGNTSSAIPTIASGLPCSLVSALVQSVTSVGDVATSHSE